MAQFNQKDFEGGLFHYGCDLEIPENAYQWLLNGRTREGNVKPIPRHLELDAPSGLKQAIATLGNTKILFVAGKAYYQLFGTTNWTQIGSFDMSATVTRIYTCLVPASTMNFKRTLASSGSLYDDIQAFPSSTVNGTPSGLVVQDGLHQPWFITIDNQSNSVIARELNTYAEWSNAGITDREYVPVGTFMMFLNQKLFIVSRDKGEIYHSISGRPLDFMVNMDSTGNKQTLEGNGGADSVSFSFDYDPITGIFPSNAPDIFIYATRSLIRLIQFDYTKTIFGEPTYIEAAKVECGNVNDKTMIEVLGDFVTIDRESLTSFNAVKQIKIESKNSVFSKPITNLLKDIKQTDKVCIGRYDDYLLFSIQTTFGPVIAIFDVIQNIWVSLDITAAVRVKEFAVLTTDTSKQIYCITYNNEVFQLFADDEDGEVCSFRTRGFAREELKEHKSQCLKLTFSGGDITDEVRVIEYVDEVYSHEITRKLKFQDLGINYPVKPPVIMPNEVILSPLTFDFARGLTGRKIVFVIIWEGTASLEELELITTDINKQTSSKQTAEAARQ